MFCNLALLSSHESCISKLVDAQLQDNKRKQDLEEKKLLLKAFSLGAIKPKAFSRQFAAVGKDIKGDDAGETSGREVIEVDDDDSSSEISWASSS